MQPERRIERQVTPTADHLSDQFVAPRPSHLVKRAAQALMLPLRLRKAWNGSKSGLRAATYRISPDGLTCLSTLVGSACEHFPHTPDPSNRVAEPDQRLVYSCAFA
jgi:hypothetical protein